MVLENITGNLLAYKELEPDTFQHSDQLTTERRTNLELRTDSFYTADGELYTIQKGKILWVITREPQNLVLQNIDQAYSKLTQAENYFPNVEPARLSLAHPDTVVVDIKRLKLVKDNKEYGHFEVNPKKVKKLNSQQRMVAQRIYGPDEDNFEQNMEMFAEAEKVPYIFVLLPSYVQSTLGENGKEYLGRASWLLLFNGDSLFIADGRGVDDHIRLRGVRREVVAVGDAPKNETIVPPVPQETRPSMDEIIACLGDDIALSVKPRVEDRIRKLYKQ